MAKFFFQERTGSGGQGRRLRMLMMGKRSKKRGEEKGIRRPSR